MTAPGPASAAPAPAPAPAPVVFYPQYCFHLSPTLNKWCPLRAADVQALTRRGEFDAQNVFFCRNHPVKWVRLAGVVVAADTYYGRRVYTLDDGSSATVECVVDAADASRGTTAAPAAAPATAPEAAADTLHHSGHIVGVKGELRLFRDTLQVRVVQIVRLRSTTDEVRFWAKVQAFAGVLSRPWILDDAVVRQCRREAEGVPAPKP